MIEDRYNKHIGIITTYKTNFRATILQPIVAEADATARSETRTRGISSDKSYNPDLLIELQEQVSALKNESEKINAELSTAQNPPTGKPKKSLIKQIMKQCVKAAEGLSNIEQSFALACKKKLGSKTLYDFINYIQNKPPKSGGKRVKRTIKYKKLHNITYKKNMRNGKRRTKMGKGKNKPNKFSRKYM
jgi:hypothetical protein